RQVFSRDFYAVSGCSRDWPNDEVRDSCENATKLRDGFYSIPVTTERKITYSNAFCALCNYDLDSTSIFWNASGTGVTGLQVTPPQYVSQNKDYFLWPCDSRLVDIQTCPEGSDFEIKRKCSTYFAPVKLEGSEYDVVFKNAYCGLCNGVDPSSMHCVPKQLVPKLWPRLLNKKASSKPNLVTLIRPVMSRDSCFSWYNNKCYIRNLPYHFANISATVESRTVGNTTNVTGSQVEPYNVQTYLTLICITLSLVCLFLKGVVYVTCKSARKFSSGCTLCLSGTLFCSHLLFLLGNSFDLPKTICLGFAIALHYGFLCTFFWTSVLSFDIWKNVVAVRPSSTGHGSILLYCVVAWGVPLIIVALCAVLHWTAPDFMLSPQYGRYACWIGSLWSQLAFFLTPMSILLLYDISLYVHVVVHIRRMTKRAAFFDFKGGGTKSSMALFVKLAFIMVTTWLVGFVGAFFNVFALDIVVIIFIGLQGVYLFFGFKDYRHMFPKRRKKLDENAAANASTANTELPLSEKDITSTCECPTLSESRSLPGEKAVQPDDVAAIAPEVGDVTAS
ncbi:adhesion G protein-coupled receptor E3-like, partial [Dermacentor silvarum]|uniref:adhesion G protein-coupled receptor E3-like n=1 Tax=Dermacentor silvarum TaxID=543639 RepID=UPI0021019D72